MVFFFISVFETTAIIKICKCTVLSSGSFCQIYRVTDEALIAETIVWPNFFPMNVFFALKGSKLFIIIYLSWVQNVANFELLKEIQLPFMLPQY